MFGLDSKKTVVIIFLVIFIGLPLGFGIYKGSVSLYRYIFGIKSDAEIKGEQRVMIKNYENANKQQQKIIKYKTNQSKINDQVVMRTIKQEENVTKKYDNIKNKVSQPITKKEKQKLVNQIELMNKKKITTNDTSNTVSKKEVITIDPVEYKVQGMKDINSIYDAYELTVKDE